MPRFLVERSFAREAALPLMSPGAAALAESHASAGVAWIESFVSADRQRSFCICDAASPEAVRRAAGHGGLPVDRITEVRVVSPWTLC